MPTRHLSFLLAGAAALAAVAAAAVLPLPGRPGEPPRYDVTAHPANARTGADVQLAISAGRADRWEVDVDGDGFDDGRGRADADGAGGATVRFASDGVHRVRVRVIPRSGRALTLTRVYATRSANLPPAVKLGFGPRQQLVLGDSLVLAAFADDDSGAPVGDLRWDVDGDGAFDDARGERPAPVADPGLPLGRRTVRVRATDADGASTIARLRLDVVTARRARVMASPVARVGAPTPVVATNVTGGVRWDLDADGAFDDALGRAHGGPAWTPAVPGTHVLRLRDAATGATAQTRVRVAAGNQAPVGRIIVPPGARTLENVALAVIHHDDVWRAGARVTWDLDGDDAFDDAEGETVAHAWSTPGVRRVRALVEDGEGLATVVERPIAVTPLQGR